jgi:hypothetical protein
VTRTLCLSMLLLSVGAVVVGCDPPPTAIPPGEAQPVSAAPPPRPESSPARPIEVAPDAAPVTPEAGGTSGAPPAAAKTGAPPAAGKSTGAPPATAKTLAAVGAACDSAADCATGVCEGEGCAPGRGRCAAKNRSCTRDRRAYCGCDGNTFYSSGSCPGRRFASRGVCGATGGGGGAKLAADGTACKAAADCQSGICEGEGCGDGTPGTCVSRKRPCTADMRAFCGCDGVTFGGSSTCPGRRYAARGECKK